MDDWWHLSRNHKNFRSPPHLGLLKQFGYLALLSHVEEAKPKRVLEFGHGIWTELDRCLLRPRQDGVELWGVDDYADLPYMTESEKWLTEYEAYTARRPGVKFVRALLGDPESTRGVLPEGHFDLICSVSVLEELPQDIVEAVLSHCRRLLVPGGKLMITWDFPLNQARSHLARFLRTVKAAGFTLDVRHRELRLPEFPIRENQLEIMLWYQQNEGEERVFWGDYSTALIEAYND